MLKGNGSNHHDFPTFLEENRFQYPSNGSNHLQLFGNMPVGLSANQIHPNKRVKESETIPNQNIVSTGLKLSYDDDERNSSVTSASGSMTASPSIIFDDLKNVLHQQKDEFDQFIKIQEEQLAKGVREMKRKHATLFLTAIEKGINKKLLDKDVEIENLNQKNKEVVERIKQVALEAQNWHYRANYNESVINILNAKLQHALSQGAAEQCKEGFGDNDVVSSYIEPPIKEMKCKACLSKEVSVLLMPCRHLCLCKECDEFVNVCPLCRVIKTGGVQVYLS